MPLTVDVSNALNAVNNLVAKLPKAVETAFAREAHVIENQARCIHKYKLRTGKLKSATFVQQNRMEIDGWLDETKAPYAQYVHDGTSDIQPDPFLANAFDSRTGEIERMAEAAVDAAISAEGLA